MLLSDRRCNHPYCSEKSIYRMIGKCINCHADPVLLLFTQGHETERGKCPVCGCDRTVMPQRLATPDEIPSAGEDSLTTTEGEQR